MNRFREPVSGLTHLVGAFLALGGLVWLVWITRDDPARMLSMLVYGASLVLLYSASTALHLINGSPRVYDLLVRFDYAAIFALIAGSYTPFCYNALIGVWRWGTLGVIWAIAVTGIVIKLFFVGEQRLLFTLLFVGMGWLGVFLAPAIASALPIAALELVLAGGLVYSAGALIFALQKPNFHPLFGYHEVWHLFVLAGSALHFVAILLYVAGSRGL